MNSIFSQGYQGNSKLYDKYYYGRFHGNQIHQASSKKYKGSRWQNKYKFISKGTRVMLSVLKVVQKVLDTVLERNLTADGL